MKVWISLFLWVALALSSLHAETSPKEALEQLKEGNQRFIEDQSIHPNRTAERREETSSLQEPFAVIVGCSDSRVSPEILFDQGIGDLFIVRIAGNVVGPIELASIEYSALYLHSSLIVVLGHENCGAVQAVINGTTKDIEPIAALIQPAIKGSEKNLEKAVKKNVARVVEQLQKVPALKQLLDKKALLIKGGYYNFHSGQVEFLD